MFCRAYEDETTARPFSFVSSCATGSRPCWRPNSVPAVILWFTGRSVVKAPKAPPKGPGLDRSEAATLRISLSRCRPKGVQVAAGCGPDKEHSFEYPRAAHFRRTHPTHRTCWKGRRIGSPAPRSRRAGDEVFGGDRTPARIECSDDRHLSRHRIRRRATSQGAAGSAARVHDRRTGERMAVC